LAELGGGTSGKELADVQPVDSALRLPPGQPDKSDAEDKW